MLFENYDIVVITETWFRNFLNLISQLKKQIAYFSSEMFSLAAMKETNYTGSHRLMYFRAQFLEMSTLFNTI